MNKTIFGYDVGKNWEYENGFYLTSHVSRLAKLCSHYEFYKSIVDLPGHVVECGVYKGASLVRFATFRHILESPDSRKIIGFDAFGKFPEPLDALDSAFVKRFEQQGGRGISVDELRKVFEQKGFPNSELVSGDILETVPQYVKDHPELKIALLQIDVDVYEPTRVILEYLFERVVKGGLVLLDDFNDVAGATRAVDEFFAQKDICIKKLPTSRIPSYVRR